MNPNSKPVANPVVVLREEFDDWAVLFHPDTAAAVGINPVGVALWKGMDGRRTLAQLGAEVCSAFDDVPETVEAEAGAFVDELEQKGFVGYAAGDGLS